MRVECSWSNGFPVEGAGRYPFSPGNKCVGEQAYKIIMIPAACDSSIQIK